LMTGLLNDSKKSVFTTKVQVLAGIMATRKINIAKTLMLELSSSLRTPGPHSKIREIFLWTNVTVAKKRACASLVANLDTSLETAEIMPTRIRFQRERRLGRRRTNKRLRPLRMKKTLGTQGRRSGRQTPGKSWNQ